MTKDELLEKLVAEQHSGSPDEVGGLCARRYDVDGLTLIRLVMQCDRYDEARKLRLVS